MKLAGKETDMFETFLTCKPEELLQYTEQIFPSLDTVEDAERLIRVLWKRVPELTVQQEKELHKVGRKIRKRFDMKPIRN